MEKRTRWGGVRPGDFAVIFALLLLSGILLVFGRMTPESGAGIVSVVTAEESLRFPLSEARVIPITSGGCHLTLTVENGAAQITESDCPNGFCTASGAISRPGQSIVCLPARVLVKIIGEEGAAHGSDADFILP